MTSEPFATPSRRYLNRLAAEWLTRHWLMLALPIAAVLLWSAFDLRALYVLLIIIFLLYPMGLTLVWFNYAMSPGSIRAITPKRLTLLSSGVRISYPPKDIEANPRPVFPDEVLAWESISDAELSSDSITLITGTRLDERLDIPLAALGDNLRHELMNIIEIKFMSDLS